MDNRSEGSNKRSQAQLSQSRPKRRQLSRFVSQTSQTEKRSVAQTTSTHSIVQTSQSALSHQETSIKIIAVSLANIIKEMSFFEAYRSSDKTKAVNELCDEPPPRDKLGFQTKNERPTAKVSLGDQIDDSSDEFFPKTIFAVINFSEFELRKLQNAGNQFKLQDRTLLRKINSLNKENYKQVRFTRKEVDVLIDFLEDKAVSEATLAKKIICNAGEHDAQHIFCAVHCDYVLMSGIDIEHTEPCKKMIVKQSRLLEFLNNPINETLVDEFLKQEGISDYFRRDGRQGDRVKGTKYFYNICYNNADNLLLLCHACNINKNSDDPIEWYEKKELYGKQFTDAIKRAGGLHEGVLFPTVCQKNDNDPKIIIAGKEIILHTDNNKQNLGSFIHQWFFNRYSEMRITQTNFYIRHYKQIKTDLREIQHLKIQAQAETDQAKERVEAEIKKLDAKIKKKINTYDAVFHFHDEDRVQVSSSQETLTSSDDSQDEKGRCESIKNSINQVFLITHKIKRVKKILEALYPDMIFTFNKFSKNEIKQLQNLQKDKWKLGDDHNEALFSKVRLLAWKNNEYKRVAFRAEEVKLIKSVFDKNRYDQLKDKLLTKQVSKELCGYCWDLQLRTAEDDKVGYNGWSCVYDAFKAYANHFIGQRNILRPTVDEIKEKITSLHHDHKPSVQLGLKEKIIEVQTERADRAIEQSEESKKEAEKEREHAKQAEKKAEESKKEAEAERQCSDQKQEKILLFEKILDASHKNEITKDDIKKLHKIMRNEKLTYKDLFESFKKMKAIQDNKKKESEVNPSYSLAAGSMFPNNNLDSHNLKNDGNTSAIYKTKKPE